MSRYICSGKQFYENYDIGIIREAFENYVSCIRAGGNEIGGMLIACGNMKMTDVVEKDDIKKAYEMGRSIA